MFRPSSGNTEHLLLLTITTAWTKLKQSVQTKQQRRTKLNNTYCLMKPKCGRAETRVWRGGEGKLAKIGRIACLKTDYFRHALFAAESFHVKWRQQRTYFLTTVWTWHSPCIHLVQRPHTHLQTGLGCSDSINRRRELHSLVMNQSRKAREAVWWQCFRDKAQCC